MSRTPSREELLRRVTGQGPRTLPQVPPPARAVPGLVGNPPLPQGRPVSLRRPETLTPREREHLTQAGWDDTMPIPHDMGTIIQQVTSEVAQECAAENLPPPAVTAEQQARVKERLRRGIEASLAADEAEAGVGVPPSVAQLGAEAMATYQQARAAARAATRASPAPPQAQAEVGAPPQPAPQPTPRTARPQPPPQAVEEFPDEPQAPPPPEDTGAAAHLAFCPHCKFDLAAPPDPEPPQAKKMAFLHALLGSKPYEDEISLFGDHLVVTFRTLRQRELDMVFRQAHLDRQSGKLLTELDYWTQVNRYRFFLQLRAVRSPDVDGIEADLPDGLNAAVSQGAARFWDYEDPGPGATPLPAIADYVMEDVLRTENLFRAASGACEQFNKEVVRLEANASNPDFWSATATPP